MDELIYAVWLSAKTGIKPLTKCRIFDLFKSFKDIYFCDTEKLKQIEGIRPSDIRALSDKDLKRAQDVMAYCGKSGITVIDITSSDYPERLKHIFDPPLVIYVKGRLPDIDSAPVISVIGTRSADGYGLKVSADIAYEISLGGGIVVSGLTKGADAAAAEGALASGRPLAAVLGTSHDRCTSALARQVEKCGALISEYPPGTEANKSFFRARNRIAAGISVGVVVTQAPENSGTKLFAQEAAEQGKDIFVVPGNVDSENSAGIYELMRDGAQPVINGRDVLREYLYAFPGKIFLETAGSAVRPKSPVQNSREKPVKKTRMKTSVSQSAPATVTAPAPCAVRLDGLNEKQRAAAECLADGPKFVEEIM